MSRSAIGYEGTEVDCHCPRAVPIKKFIEDAGDPPEPVVDGILMPGITVLIGAPGCGKTHLANELARAVGKGESAFGRFRTKKGAVLIVEEEHHEGDLSKRYELAGMADAEIYVLHAENARLDVPAWVDWLVREVDRTRAIFCILDPFADLHEKDESSNTEMKEVTNGLKDLKGRCPNTAFLVIHHPTKSASKDGVEPEMSDGRGAGRLMGMADAIYGMACKERSPQALKISFKCRKRRDGPAIDPLLLTLKFTELGAVWDANTSHCEDANEVLRNRIIDALKAHGPFRTKEELKKSVKGNATKKSSVLQSLVAEDIIRYSDDVGYHLASGKSSPPPAANDNEEP